MKQSPRRPLTRLSLCCVAAQLFGCLAQPGWQSQPYGQPAPPFAYGPVQPHYGYKPLPPVVHAPLPITPGLPTSPPGTVPPGTTPAPPIAYPTPSPTVPPPGYDKEWSPWPLPPFRNLVANRGAELVDQRVRHRANVVLSRLGPQGMSSLARSSRHATIQKVGFQQLASISSAAADRQLKYRGGHIIRDLRYVNLYVSGDSAWSTAEIEQIEKSLAAAMRDEHLNNVLRQYFENQPITSIPLPPHPLVGYVPQKVTRGDIQNYLAHLYRRGYLDAFELDDTVINLVLPPRTVLSDSPIATHTALAPSAASAAYLAKNAVDAAVDSTVGLAGYHGSVVTSDGRKIYFAVSVYSQRDASGATSGIPVFPESWKNVVATLYHQLLEARTDPNVEDALRQSSDLSTDRILGWVSDSGLEIGDVFQDATVPISSIIREVPLADGSGVVPIQLPYSNAARGVEGPISRPHPVRAP